MQVVDSGALPAELTICLLVEATKAVKVACVRAMRHVFVSCEVQDMLLDWHDGQPQAHLRSLPPPEKQLHREVRHASVTREKLLQVHAELFATLTAREESLHFKRR